RDIDKNSEWFDPNISYKGVSCTRTVPPNYNNETVAYRLEAERLFNIGINLGVSSNEDRRMMIERLIDMEENDVSPADDFEGSKCNR
ncbi:hypothetical protein A2U01_0071699, partial [Trifolium medium]|nr:hypothetical protein [Trifolium medium]